MACGACAAAGLVVFAAAEGMCDTHYVNLASAKPTWPYLSWATASTAIQGAVDAAASGDTVLVAPGTYNKGGKKVAGNIYNRVVIEKKVAVKSASGAGVTIIEGGIVDGKFGMRCVYMSGKASLDGFTLTKGLALNSVDPIEDQTGGGAYCVPSSNCALKNCVVFQNIAGYSAGGVDGGNLTACYVLKNLSKHAGGAIACVMDGCTVSYNVAEEGGGVVSSTLANCTVSYNRSQDHSGGANCCTMTDCVIARNTAGTYAGGALGCTLDGCTIQSNSAKGCAGGLFNCWKTVDCTIAYNTSGEEGAGAAYGDLDGCTLIGNISQTDGGGAYGCDLTKCDLIRNHAEGNGGGTGDCTILNSSFSLNSADEDGGGAWDSILYNCLLTENIAAGCGGGTFEGRPYNCTMAKNSAWTAGGGAYGFTYLTNCIVKYNSAPSDPEVAGDKIYNCCTTPVPPGKGNIDTNPQFVSLEGEDFHLKSISPCINAAKDIIFDYPYDLDGNPRVAGPAMDMGCYEKQ